MKLRVEPIPMDADLLAALYVIVAPAALTVVGYAGRDLAGRRFWRAGFGVIGAVVVASLAATERNAWIEDVLFAVIPGASSLALLCQRPARRNLLGALVLGPFGYAAGWLAALAIAAHFGIGR